MSGGALEYGYYHVEEFVKSLEYKIKNNKQDGYNYNGETIRELKRILKWCKIASKLMEHAEWLYSGDDGEEIFMENIRKIK